ncbi:MAG: ABC transporter permease [Candidatus Omnitrophica bacterium]|nr:ABC transporter permease [Candidatus Omnitrophota bacterium]
MIGLLARRLAWTLPVLLGITVVSFFTMHLAPGGPTDVITDLNIKISLQAKAELVKLYGLDRPLPQQYLAWLARCLRGDFGRSFKDGRTVSTKIAERIPVTLTINLAALFLILLAAIPLGVSSAAAEGSLWDHGTGLFLFILFALPSFWVAILGLDLFGVRLAWLPVSGLSSLGIQPLSMMERLADGARHLILPVGVMVLGGLTGYARYLRSSVLNVLKQDYIRTAVAKGLSEKAVLYRHALRNALLPFITLLGLSVPGLLGGSVILESIFAIPGMGRLFFDSVMSRDYPVIMGLLVLGAVLTLIGNLLADLAYALADPRIRYEEEAG